MANRDRSGYGPMLDQAALDERRVEASRAGYDEPEGGCDLPEHEALPLEEVLALGARLEVEGLRDAGGETLAAPGVKGTGKTRQDRGRSTGRAARGRPGAGAGAPRVTAVAPPMKRKAARRRGIRLGRDMPAPSADGLGREET